MIKNPLTSIDFYKADHRRQYPEGTTEVYANFTPRSSRLAKVADGFDNQIVFFGLQYFIKDFLMNTWNREFFSMPKDIVVKAYKRRMDTALGKDMVDTKHIEELHDLGYLPIKIKALPEGSRSPISVPVLTIVNTQPNFFWITNYIETIISCYLWKPITSATTAFEYKRLLVAAAEKTGTPLEFVNFQAHDLSFRGMSSLQDAALSGAAHLTSFWGTDSIPAIDLVEDYYNADAEKEMIGCSVPATEHSVMCMGMKDGELATFKRLINELYPSGIVSIVSDTWDFWKVITEYTVELKDEIMARDGKVVIRPDSGDPVKIICGEQFQILNSKSIDAAKRAAISFIVDRVQVETPHGEYGEEDPSDIFFFEGKYYQAEVEIEWNRHDKQYYYMDGESLVSFEEIELKPEQKGAIECLWEVFGGTITDKGYKMLDSHIGLIYGDSITLERADQILKQLEAKGFASGNVVFGVGSYTYQYATRDSYGFAMKATSGIVNYERRDIFKDPKTDNGTKKSAKGLLRVEFEDGKYKLYDQQTKEQEETGALLPVFENGKLLTDFSFSDIKNNLK
jgi:nicotinamide phosphoribosyltransferase